MCEPLQAIWKHCQGLYQMVFRLMPSLYAGSMVSSVNYGRVP